MSALAHWGGARRLGVAAAVALLVVVSLAPIASGAPLGLGAGAAPNASLSPSAAGTTAPLLPGPPGGITPGNNSTGNGTFFTSSALPSAPFASSTCVGGFCYNVSNDVATNLTSRGVLVAAYTSLTNNTPCASLVPYAVSSVAFVSSTNGGATWSSPAFLGNPVCSGPSLGYPDAWQPTVTSLSNGTIVLAYVEYNLTAGSLPPLNQFSWPPSHSRLVLTESYDNGTTWTSPQVLNISNPASAPPGLQYTPAFPSVTAYGNTIYLTWMSLTIEDSFGSIALLVSSTGGASWSPTIPISTGPFAYYAMDPQVTTDSQGRVYIAYVANISAGFGLTYGQVWVASSASNGTVFNYTDVTPLYTDFAWEEGIPLTNFASSPNPTSFGPFQNPSPQIVASRTTGQIYVAFVGGEYTDGTPYYECYSTSCIAPAVYFFSSANNGSTWTEANTGSLLFNPAEINPGVVAQNSSDGVESVALAAAPSGTVYLEASYYNGTDCYTAECGVETEAVFSTSDNGTTFTAPATVVAPYTPLDYGWNGEYGSVAIVNDSPRFFWSLNSCPAWISSPCSPFAGYPFSSGPSSTVEESAFFNGTGTTLSFDAVGLPTTAYWTVNVMGNVRTGLGNATLSVAGVPTGSPIYFAIPYVNLTLAHYYLETSLVTPASGTPLSGPTTVTVPFKEYVPVTIAYTVPHVTSPACSPFTFDVGPCPSFYPACTGTPPLYNFTVGCYSLYFNPVPPSGKQWVPAGQSYSVAVVQAPQYTCAYPYNGAYGYTECYIYKFNLLLLGWSGTGGGSVSSSDPNITFSPTGPVTETASFLIQGFCMIFYDNFGTPYIQNYGCENFSAPLIVDEQGLPSGTPWGVTFSGAAGPGAVASTAGSITENASVGFAGITPWNVPSSTPGWVWQGTSLSGAYVLLPTKAAVIVNYTLVPEASLAVPIHISTIGLPANLAGNLSLTNSGTSSVADFSVGSTGVNGVIAGGSYVLNASPVITNQGVSYYPEEVYANVALANESNQSSLSPASLVLDGATDITIAYVPQFWLQLSAGVGGSVSPASRWVTNGSAVTIHAIPNAGYVFQSWIGTGAGATSGPQDQLANVIVQPRSPVTEFALFAPVAAVTYTVTVQPTGIPAGLEYSVSFGGSTYAGVGVFTIANVTPGSFAVAFPDVTGVGTAVSRYALSSLTASAGLSGNMLTVSENVTLMPSYSAQYLVSITTVGSGSLSLGPGEYWEPASSTLFVNATPALGSVLTEWVGAFNGNPSSVLSTYDDLEVTLTGSLTLVAQFGPAPAVLPATYHLTLSESGLPAGTSWQAVVSPGFGASGGTANLTVGGLNGTYTVTVPTVYTVPGVRFVSSDTAGTMETVASNMPFTVTFTQEDLVTSATSAYGSDTTTQQSWVAYGQVLAFNVPTPPSGWTFAGWLGSGAGSYTGPATSFNVTVSGPFSETATYAASASSSSSSSSTPTADWVVIGLIVAVLAAIGIAEGYNTGRRRKGPPKGPAPMAARRPVEGQVVSTVQGPSPPPALPPTAPAKTPDWSES